MLELKRDAPALVILNNLYKHTPLQTSFAVNTVALVDGVPRTLNLRDALVALHRPPGRGHHAGGPSSASTRRSDRAHIVEGLLKALDMIDADHRRHPGLATTSRRARDALMAEPFEFSEVQAEHILDMQLSRLTRLGRANLEEELAKLRETIAELEAILGDDVKLREVIKDELAEIRDEFADAAPLARSRSTSGDLDIEDLIDDEELVVTMTAKGYIKTVAVRRVPHPGPWWPWGGRAPSSRTRTTSPTSSTPRPTPTCCSSRTGAGCTA